MPPGDDPNRELVVFLCFFSILIKEEDCAVCMVEDKEKCGCFHNCCSLFFLSFHQLGRGEEPGKLWNLPPGRILGSQSQICGAGRLLRDQIRQTSRGRDDAPKLRERTRLAQDCQSQ